MAEKTYIAIDLKSFYASVECVDKDLDPLRTHLLVADESRTDKTICLAVSPALKEIGVPGRPRLFEAKQRIAQVNQGRLQQSGLRCFRGGSSNRDELAKDPSLKIVPVIAPPRMARYVEVSAQIYETYLDHVSADDIHVYSIDEVFIDVTGYLRLSGMTAREFTQMLIQEVLAKTGITATAGIGTNLYLAKIAMDIVAKHAEPDENGVRLAELDEESYRRTLWGHRPITDFWRVGKGIARRLAKEDIYTMGDIARVSIGQEGAPRSEELFYNMLGINAELLIDHAWGWEPVTMQEIKAYKPEATSQGTGQVLMRPYKVDEARLVVREMAEELSYTLLDKGLVCNKVVLTVGYDRESLIGAGAAYAGPIHVDHYGREVPQHAHGTEHLPQYTNAVSLIVQGVLNLFDRIVDPILLVRRLNLTAIDVEYEQSVEHAAPDNKNEQLDLFTDYNKKDREEQQREDALAVERDRQKAVLAARKRFGKNAVVKGSDLMEGATAMQRNNQIGGHQA